MTQAKSEQVMVGLFVLVAAALLVGTVFVVGGISGRQVKTYRAYFTFAGGVEPGTAVRYSGGPKVGHVEKMRIDPQDPSRIEMTFSVDADLPVKMDSRVKIMAMTPLGDNHVEVLPGTPGSADAPTGTRLPSDAYVDLNSLMAQVQDITPQAQQLLKSLNDRVVELKVTLGRVDDLLGAQNQSNLSAVLAESRGLIQENRPQLKSTLEHLNEGERAVATCARRSSENVGHGQSSTRSRRCHDRRGPAGPSSGRTGVAPISGHGGESDGAARPNGGCEF